MTVQVLTEIKSGPAGLRTAMFESVHEATDAVCRFVGQPVTVRTSQLWVRIGEKRVHHLDVITADGTAVAEIGPAYREEHGNPTSAIYAYGQ